MGHIKLPGAICEELRPYDWQSQQYCHMLNTSADLVLKLNQRSSQNESRNESRSSSSKLIELLSKIIDHLASKDDRESAQTRDNLIRLRQVCLQVEATDPFPETTESMNGVWPESARKEAKDSPFAGTYTWIQTSREQSLYHGQGILVCAKGHHAYQGTFQDGKMHGLGRIILLNSRK